jgi:hypothetical protein
VYGPQNRELLFSSTALPVFLNRDGVCLLLGTLSSEAQSGPE